MHKTANLSSDEETFFDIITLGLVNKLRNMEGIVELNIEKKIPCSRLTVAAWEQNNGISFPADLKEFYTSTDGFEMSWKYRNCNQRENIESENLIVRGEIKISALSNVRPLHFVHKQLCTNQSRTNKPKISHKTKSNLYIGDNTWNQDNFKMAFVLSSHENIGTICLVYRSEKGHNAAVSSPTHATTSSSIWLLDTCNNWHFMAKDFSSYFRMMLIHIGLQDWQLKFTSQGLTTSCKRITSIVLPHLFYEDKTYEANKLEMAANVINSNIFKFSQTSSKSNKSTPIKSKRSGQHKVKKKETLNV